MKQTDLATILDHLPTSPGVYLMKGLNGKVVYVGKANNLRNRVRQYFAPGTSDTRHFVKNLAARLSTIETVITGTEKEALLLEYNLIQRYMPRYNIRLTDDKRFLHLRLDPTADWPRLDLVRKPKKDSAHYFGPFHTATSARETLRLVNRHFKLRNCRDATFKNRVRPCLQHQIHRCMAPCTMDIGKDLYAQQVNYVRMFLEGRREDLVNALKQRMEESAQAFHYEAAAVLRDQIQAVEEALSPQRVTEISDEDRDVIGMHREGDMVSVVIMDVLAGRLVGMRDFFFREQEFPDDELLSSFIVQQYSESFRFPHEVLVSRKLADAGSLAEFISEKKGHKVRVHCPQRGKRLTQVQLADENAQEAFRTRLRKKEGIEQRLAAVQKKLHLAHPPRRMECVDIAHFAGTNTVGAISAVLDAAVSRKDGRTYRIKSAAQGDDYGAMYEVLRRRFERASAGDAGWEAPDLLVVDGGKGQLNIALKVLEELGLDAQAVVALAKERSDKSPEPMDRVFLPGRMNPIPVRDTSPLVLLSVARDEAHRLANTFQAKTRRKKTIGSQLDAIPGVGAKTRQALLKHFGSVKRVKEATTDQLCQVPGVGSSLAGAIHTHLNGAAK